VLRYYYIVELGIYYYQVQSRQTAPLFVSACYLRCNSSAMTVFCSPSHYCFIFLVSVACFSITILLNYGPPPPNCFASLFFIGYIGHCRVWEQQGLKQLNFTLCIMVTTLRDVYQVHAAIKGCEYRHGYNTASRLFFRIWRLMAAIKGFEYRYGHNTAGVQYTSIGTCGHNRSHT
jgi:hypothetical protein